MGLFKKAQVSDKPLKMAIAGPSGTGKTWTALKILTEMGISKIAVIDTEHGGASFYARDYDFDHLELDSYDPLNYISAIKAAEKEGYQGIIIDSYTHAWAGKDGVLQIVEETARKEKNGNKFAGWNKGTDIHEKLVEAILSSPLPIICTLRSKTAYEQTEENGKKVVKKLGLQPIQRDGVEFEFDVVCHMEPDHTLVIEKSRINALDKKGVFPLAENVAKIYLDWRGNNTSSVVAKPIEKKIREEFSAAETLTEEEGKALYNSLKEQYPSIALNATIKDCGILSMKSIPKDKVEALKAACKKAAGL